MASQNEISNEFAQSFNFSSYRLHKPLIMDLNVLRIPIADVGEESLQHYLRTKDKIQGTYEIATKSSQKFVIPELEMFKEKYQPTCCANPDIAEVSFNQEHSHFEYKIIQLLESLKTYLDNTIKLPRRILEIKLLENENCEKVSSEN